MKKILFITGVVAMFTILSCGQSAEEKAKFAKAQADSAHVAGFIKCTRAGYIIGNNYVTIGTQVWTTVNLNVSTFHNGDPIPEAESQEEWKEAGQEKRPAWCYYNGDPYNSNYKDCKGEMGGRLYNWYAVNDSRGLAPQGWHIPSVDEWTTLYNFLGGANVAGMKMKTAGWKNDGTGDNSSGFSGFPTGARQKMGEYKFKNNGGVFWSSTETPYNVWHVSPSSYFAYLYEGNSNLLISFNDRGDGYSVRCIKDDAETNNSQNAKLPETTTNNNLLDYLKTLNGKHLFDKDVHLWNNAEFKKRLIKLH